MAGKENEHECSCQNEQSHEHEEACERSCEQHGSHHHAHPMSQMISANVGGGVALCKLANHDGAIVVSCTLELEGASLSPRCLSLALQGVALDVERAEGIVGHIKCAAEADLGTARISVTTAQGEPTLQVNGLETLDEDADINIAVIAYGVDPSDLLDMLLTRLERVL